MTSRNRPAARGGVSVLTVLLIVFVTLKLSGVVDWPWVWVLAPFWVPWVLFLIGGCAILIGALLVMGREKIKTRRR